MMNTGIGLTAQLKLCLAHYCDIHGPTPLMVTEGLRSPCSMCFEEPNVTNPSASCKLKADKRTRSSGPTSAPHSRSSAALHDGIRNLGIGRSGSAPASEQDANAQRAALRRSAAAAGHGSQTSSSALETPPESPRPVYQQPRRDSSFRRTYDDTVTKKQGPCDNCAMTLPRRQASSVPSDAHAAGVHGPTLRTKAPVERVFGAAGQCSPPNSQTSSDTDGDKDAAHQIRSRKQGPTASSSRDASCSSTSTLSERAPYHLHYVHYTSTHEPVFPDSFSLIRASCLRALSFETLPRAPSTTTPASSPQLNSSSSSFITTTSAGSAPTGGPIFFGDSIAGFTTAYIFRIPDMHARGHKRVYAFLALSTHRERLAMKTFNLVSQVFENLAMWIQQLAEAEAERTTTNTSPIGSFLYSGGGQPQSHSSTTELSNAVDRSSSSFLTGGSAFTRRMGGAPGASPLKARGLAELVGQPDFFIELHGKFVQLLFEVGVALNS